MGYEIGDMVVIKSRVCGHKFKIGQVVHIYDKDPNCYRAISKDGEKWWVTTPEIKPLENYTNSTVTSLLDKTY